LAIEVVDVRAFSLLLPPHSSALNIATHINRIITWSWLVAAVSPVLFGVIRAAGEVMAPFLIALLSVLAVQYPLAYTLQNAWEADAIWWSYPISATLNVGLGVLYYMRGGWRNARA
jgi:Na+-driven multidrug efflux pump